MVSGSSSIYMKSTVLFSILAFFTALLLISSCDLPVDLAILKKGLPIGGNTNPLGGITLFLTGQDENSYACLWIVNNSGVSTNVLTATPGGCAYGSCQSNGDLYIAGSDGPHAGSHNSVYWKISTNGGSAVATVLTSGSYTAAYSIDIDSSGTLWVTGGCDGSDTACYWTNGFMEYMHPSFSWEAVGGFVVITNVMYSSIHSGSTGYAFVNGALTALVGGSDYTGGIVVTNGVIYIATLATNGSNSYLYVSSNDCVTFDMIELSNGYVTVNYNGGMAYDSGILYVAGATPGNISPCYWTVDTASGAVNRISLPQASLTNCMVYDIARKNGVVFAVGTDGGYACYWVGSSEYFLGPLASGSSVHGIKIVP